MEFLCLSREEFNDLLSPERDILEKLTHKEIFLFDAEGDLMRVYPNEPVVIGLEQPEYITLDGKYVESTIPYDDLTGFMNMFYLDNLLSPRIPSEGHDLKYMVLFEDKKYSGCVWTYQNDKYIAMYGIRSSFSNYLNKKKGTCEKILSLLEQIANERNLTLLVPWILPSMVGFLRDNGFTEINTTDDTPERKFLKFLIYTSNYFVKKSLTEREKDTDFM